MLIKTESLLALTKYLLGISVPLAFTSTFSQLPLQILYSNESTPFGKFKIYLPELPGLKTNLELCVSHPLIEDAK